MDYLCARVARVERATHKSVSLSHEKTGKGYIYLSP